MPVCVRDYQSIAADLVLSSVRMICEQGRPNHPSPAPTVANAFVTFVHGPGTHV